MKNTICRECGGNCKPSKGLMNYHNIQTNDKTKEFTTVLEDCLKCEDCGHSFKVPQNIYLNKLKEQYIEFYSTKYSREKEVIYNTMRLFCLDTQLLDFNTIEIMEFEVNQSFL